MSHDRDTGWCIGASLLSFFLGQAVHIGAYFKQQGATARPGLHMSADKLCERA